MKIEIDSLVNTGLEFCGYDITEIVKIISIINSESCLIRVESPSRELINMIRNPRYEYAAMMNILDKHNIDIKLFHQEIDRVRQKNETI